MKRAVGVIPARFASTRFPGKPLALINGKPLLTWTIEGARTSRSLSEIIVATDDERIVKLAEASGVRAVMTDSQLPTGTDRIWQAIQRLEGGSDIDVVVNVQGDEPLIEGSLLDRLVEPFLHDSQLEMATMGLELTMETLMSPQTPKIVMNAKDEALYFSRLPIPYTRQEPKLPLKAALKHIGIYAYRTKFLEKFCAEAPTELEQAESLEQLRALYLGARIKVIRAEHDSWGVDIPEDIQKIEDILRKRNGERTKAR
ncbi:MAG: 3-deoxy-manno-octulosonate cytidylyltransferase [Proteobacteria bacterium]|nr:MAG: 3-deoxy-manno-octulosonate cytidylyltransferase [Pseudomonadota bacterium]